MKTKEVKVSELKLNDLIVAKRGGKVYSVVGIDTAGLGGPNRPYLTLAVDGKRVGHDTAFDSLKATYTVVVSEPLAVCGECLEEFDPGNLTDGVCDDCGGEECEACDGTGIIADSWGDDGPEPCDECGGDGMI